MQAHLCKVINDSVDNHMVERLASVLIMSSVKAMYQCDVHASCSHCAVQHNTFGVMKPMPKVMRGNSALRAIVAGDSTTLHGAMVVTNGHRSYPLSLDPLLAKMPQC